VFDYHCLLVSQGREPTSHFPQATGFATAQDCQSEANNKNELNEFIDAVMVYTYLLLLRT
jgi:hypothetical protein